MRAPKRRRPLFRAVAHPPEGTDLSAVARRVTYIGSPEHKDTPSFAGQPRPRADAALCDRTLASQPKKILTWLRAAVRKGSVSRMWEGGFPRYVWHRDGDTVFEARLVNLGTGEYKGYPLNPDEWPQGLEPS